MGDDDDDDDDGVVVVVPVTTFLDPSLLRIARAGLLRFV